MNFSTNCKHECLFLLKESSQVRYNTVDEQNINFVKNFHLFKSGILDDFDWLKQAFFSEVNRIKEELLKSNAVDSLEELVKQLEDHTEFLREELRNKNNIINCLSEHLSKGEDTIFSYNSWMYKLQENWMI